jgi:hypothetical protein
MATYYISGAGNDSTGNGTQGNPWLTVSKAYSSSTGGDTIHCLGTGGSIAWASQTFSTPRLIVGDSAATTILDGGAAAVTWSLQATITVSQVTFQNATNNSFQANFEMLDASQASSFMNCVFRNTTVNNPGFGEPLFGTRSVTGTNVGSLTLTACLIQNISGASSNSGMIFMSSSNIASFSFTNCTVYSNLANLNTTCFILNQGNTAVTLTNTIVDNANGTPHAWFSVGDASSYSGSNNDILGYTSNPSLPNQLSTDPLFVDTTNSNFNLRPTSPCISAGTMI